MSMSEWSDFGSNPCMSGTESGAETGDVARDCARLASSSTIAKKVLLFMLKTQSLSKGRLLSFSVVIARIDVMAVGSAFTRR